MEKQTSISASSSYNTAINIMGSLKDCSMIAQAIEAHFAPNDSLSSLIHARNSFNLRTEKSRIRIETEVERSFLSFYNKAHEELMRGIFCNRVPQQDKNFALLWHFSLSNRLFRELCIQVFAKMYYSGRASIKRNDIQAYLKEALCQHQYTEHSWTENTIATVSTKYLSFMSKLNFLEQGRVKSFQHLRPSSEAVILFLYFAQLYSAEHKDLLHNNLLPISFIPQEDLQKRLRKLALKDLFDMSYNGVALSIDLRYSYQDICDVLYN